MTTSDAQNGKPYERLKAWAACHQLVLAVYRESAKWPTEERYGLTSQARRAAFSAAANICEGSFRRGSREFRRFLDISLGSLSELSYALKLAGDLGYLPREQEGEVEVLRDHASRLTWGLYSAIAKAVKKD
ncbi:MAG TPA: four helix bundle protein [Gemmatimonadales bacterium]|nr:four helix bundle protein [Gemmatimonadales bacterium]